MLDRAMIASDVYSQVMALRGYCGVLTQRFHDPNLRRLMADLSTQHTRQAAEIAAMVDDEDVGQRVLGQPDGAAGDEHPMPGKLANPRDGSADLAFQRLVSAEDDLLLAYDRAAHSAGGDEPFVSILRRHRIAGQTALNRLRTLNGVLWV